MARELFGNPGRFAAIGACLLFLAAGSLEAGPINPFNTRPVPIGSSAEPTLQSVLDGLWGVSAVNAATDQQTTGMWGFSSSFGTSIPTMVVEYASLAAFNVFGIWFGSDTTNLYHYDLLLGSAQGSPPSPFPDAASLAIFGNTMFVTPAVTASCYDPLLNPMGEVNCTPLGGVTDPLINTSAFGFYLRHGAQYFYTVDQLNGGAAYALAFNDPGTDTWAIAFEDLRIPLGDRDFQDMVVKIESIEPVPEPTTLLLIGSGLTALWVRRRRRS